MRLELQRCTVRTWRPGDAADLVRYADCREIWRNLRDAFPHPYRWEDAERFLRACREQRPETHFAIDVDGTAVGGIGLRLGEDVERVGAEVGYWVGKPFWGRGIASEALVAVRDYAIESFGLTRVFAVPLVWSHASRRVLEKAGFTLEGRLRRSAVKDGRVVDQWLYAWVVPEDGG